MKEVTHALGRNLQSLINAVWNLSVIERVYCYFPKPKCQTTHKRNGLNGNHYAVEPRKTWLHSERTYLHCRYSFVLDM